MDDKRLQDLERDHAPNVRRARRVLAGLALLSVCGAPLSGAQSHSLEGRVLGPGGAGFGGVSVVVRELAVAEITDGKGRFTFSVPEGSYTLALSLGEHSSTVTAQVTAEGVEPIEIEVDWPVTFAESLTVVAASRRAERIVQAPAAVTLVTEEEIARQSTHGQLPRLLAGTPGAEVTQSGLYDFNLNTRGFNNSINRNVMVLIDGRDPSFPVTGGAQEWSAVSFPLDDLEQSELVRGPGSALYGAGAFGGVLLLTTKAPRDSEGGRLRLTGGELDTRRLDLRLARELGHGWYGKVVGGFQRSEDFTRSRVDSVEYEGLPREAVPLPLDEVELAFGGLRFDHHAGGQTLSLEVGTADIEGTTSLSGLGRFQQTDISRPWVRLNWNNPRFNVLAYKTFRESKDQISLSTGGPAFTESDQIGLELQGNKLFARGRGRFVAGASYGELTADSADRQGVQTAFPSRISAERIGVFAQVDYDLRDNLKLVVSERWDDGDLHDAELSSRVALVYGATPRHIFRLSFSDAFQSPNLAQFFLGIPIAPPLDLSPIEAALAPLLGGVALGFEEIPFLAVGNMTLATEKVRGLDFGYRGSFGRKTFLDLTIYRNERRDFTTNLLPQTGTSLGRLNPEFGPYAPPAALSPEAAAAVTATLAAVLPPGLFESLSNFPDGSPVLPFLSFGTAGQADSEGLELGLTYAHSTAWRFQLNYSYFDFEIRESAAESPFSANTPENQLSAEVSYVGGRFDALARYRFVDEIDWVSGVFTGTMPSYEVTDLSLNYQFHDRWKVGASVANLFDERHFEIFGGDLLRRRMLLHLDFSW